MRDPELSRDLVQETLKRAYRDIQVYDDARPFTRWIYGILRKNGLHLLRNRMRRQFADSPPAENRDACGEQQILQEIKMAFLGDRKGRNCRCREEPKFWQLYCLFYDKNGNNSAEIYHGHARRSYRPHHAWRNFRSSLMT
ncbi:MAG: hypothetical protein HY716_11110 [Planctomycetes bacterium]|nr:hypothetical protein [Planctomycetota bacterium]